MLYELFYASDDNHRAKRRWILRLLADGVANVDDYKLYQRRHVLEILMTHFASPLADEAEMDLIVEVRVDLV